MIKELVRILGISFILSGIFLFLYNPSNEGSDAQEENQLLHHEVASLQTKLKKTEKELAHLQTITSEANANEEKQQDAQSEHETQTKEKGAKEASENNAPSFTLRIESGTSSEDVATQLEKAGIIENAHAFNEQLKAQSLTTNIQIGVYEIDASMSSEAIAKLITTRPKSE